VLKTPTDFKEMQTSATDDIFHTRNNVL